MGAAGTGCVKGLLLVHLREYLVDGYGDAEWEGVAARLRTSDPEVWSGLILSSSWYLKYVAIRKPERVPRPARLAAGSASR